MDEFNFKFGGRVRVVVKGFYEGCLGTIHDFHFIDTKNDPGEKCRLLQYSVRLDYRDLIINCSLLQLEDFD